MKRKKKVVPSPPPPRTAPLAAPPWQRNNNKVIKRWWTTLSWCLCLCLSVGHCYNSNEYTTNIDDELCHSDCSCLDTFFQCSNIQPTFPIWITKLNVTNTNPPINNQSLLYLNRLKQLDTLFLDGNNLTIIPVLTIKALPNLHTLSFVRNQLTLFNPAQLFNGAGAIISDISSNSATITSAASSGIQHLDLRFNLITKITNNNEPIKTSSSSSSSCKSKLESLNLGWNLIDTLTSDSFICMPNLLELILTRNKLTFLPKDVFKYLGQLEKLDLSRNKLETLDSIQFNGLAKLKELNLKRNYINVLSDGVFYGLNELQTLLLDWNSIRTVEKRWLYGLKSLLVLSVAHNDVEIIGGNLGPSTGNGASSAANNGGAGQLSSASAAGNQLGTFPLEESRDGSAATEQNSCWEYTPLLEQLDLSWNHLDKLYRPSFTSLNNLLALNLQHNKLSLIQPNTFEQTPNLEILDLSSNVLDWFIEDLDEPFKGLENSLEELNLADNRIRTLGSAGGLGGGGSSTTTTFRRLLNLKVLNISKNPLSWIPPTPFINLKTTQLILSEIDSIVCDCNSQWLHSYLVHQQRLVNTRLRHYSNKNPSATGIGGGIGGTHHHHRTKTQQHHRDRDRHHHQNSLQTSFQQQQQIKNPFLSVQCHLPSALYNLPLVTIETERLECLPELQQPKFLISPKTQIFLLEAVGKLECSVQVFNSTQWKIEWRKNYVEISGGSSSLRGGGVGNLHHSVMTMTSSTATTTVNSASSTENMAPPPPPTILTSVLQVKNVTWADEGFYQCVTIAVDSTPTTSPTLSELPATITNTGLGIGVGVVYSHPANITIHSFPSFIKKPANVSVRLGSNAKLECAAKGYPLPEIAFQKDGGEDFPAALDRRFHVMPNDDSFFIMEVKLVDMGFYSCSAKNSAGEIKAYAWVTVYETPSFVAQMEDERTVEGSNAILECPASGSPKPRISWSRNGLILPPNNGGGSIIGSSLSSLGSSGNNGVGGVGLTGRGVGGTGTATETQQSSKYVLIENGSLLMIKNVDLNDSGRYECLLTNAVGTAKGYSTLTVVPAPRGGGSNGFGGIFSDGGLDNTAMTVIFIIIAVFCVVVTSAAWVVVIYRTRQRTGNNGVPGIAGKGSHGGVGSTNGIEATPLKYDEGYGYPMNQLYQVSETDKKDVAVVEGSGSCSSKDSGTGEEALLDEHHKDEDAVVGRRECLTTTFGTRVSSPLRLFEEPRVKSTPICSSGLSLVDEAAESLIVMNNSKTKKAGGGVTRVCIPIPIPSPPTSSTTTTTTAAGKTKVAASTPTSAAPLSDSSTVGSGGVVSSAIGLGHLGAISNLGNDRHSDSNSNSTAV